MKHRQVRINRVGIINPDGHVIGLDIGATAVRASILAAGTLDGRPSVTVHGIGQVELASGVVVKGEVREPDALTAALRQLWTAHKFECRNVILGVANPQVLVRDLSVPNIDPGRRAKALPFQAKEVIALPIEEVVLDFSPLETSADGETLHGLLIAAPRKPLLAMVHAVEQAKLRVARVDLASFGILRAIGGEQLTVEAVVDLGAHMTTIVIHDHGVPRLVRTLARGGDDLTANLAERLNIEVLEAETLKRQSGLDGANPEANRALAESLRPLLAEIRTSIGYFRSSRNTAPIERISLTGGGANLSGLTQVMTDQTGLPAAVVDPLQHVRNRLASKEVRGAQFEGAPSAVALGLAMGAAA
ncbi:type IV pilus assembly protein PilM [uncultured Jatrophihabitans sp.]|uniref:type IV pilus assembly protein PilM n=1 Tax=uncultured Jatrophihabitans sp. TaxID=1610747 RepID=UPI0035C98F27